MFSRYLIYIFSIFILIQKEDPSVYDVPKESSKNKVCNFNLQLADFQSFANF
jgi:hypothetical protein